MKSAVIVFPGSNCDRDISVALKKFQIKNEMVWHDESDLPKSDLVVLPGGFSYGDYLRTGCIASKSKIINDVLFETLINYKIQFKNYRFTHICGKHEYSIIRKKYYDYGLKVDLFDYVGIGRFLELSGRVHVKESGCRSSAGRRCYRTEKVWIPPAKGHLTSLKWIANIESRHRNRETLHVRRRQPHAPT